MAQDLDIERVNLECEFNNVDHRTDLNGVDRLIVRRGQVFCISLYLRGRYEPGASGLTCVAETGPDPSEQYGTRAVFSLTPSVDSSRWSAAVTSPPGDMVSLSLCAAPDAPIGRYMLRLGSSTQIQLIMLFNPWCSGDAVYMEREEDLAEYVLAQDGLLFMGSSKYPFSMPWTFGQFESGILDVCLRILDMNPKCLRNPGKDHSGRRNAVYVCRVLSAMVNCNDRDSGVLWGKWDNKYSGGESPMFWTGSVDILRRWDRSDCAPVKFGQCWVFAAVACSVARALGIPCRVVTNYTSAHDSNANLLIEHYVNEDGKPVTATNQRGERVHSEILWNYHCWVESWMTRPDLRKAEFNGWQAFDSTPQEKSDGVYCCGPVPVRAIKEGELMSKYDAPFVFAEVNADVVTYMMKKDGSRTEVTTRTWVGQKISTKRVGHDEREDITHLYKYPEGSEEERAVFKKAEHQNKLSKRPQQEGGLQLSIKGSQDMKKGCDFDVFALVTNGTSSEKMCRLVFSSCGVSYTGVLGANCGFKDLLNLQLPPGGEQKVPLKLNYSKYGSALTEHNLIRLATLLLDYSTEQVLMDTRSIVLTNPDIKVQILGEPKVKRKLAAEITLKNPLPHSLENCCFSIQGADLTGGAIISESLADAVAPGQDAKVKIYFTPSRSGLRKLVVDFHSRQLSHVKGFKNVIIAPARGE
ncbi:protein-glutamine gamma-glutamyltransferase 2-like [Eucyclogobius newberryi]|uniref:protein-glutamine gamma-glutamyltransferase 2-like n=1 Tax=Eucyclogobius newberryi TaxID=166745 RepID=UPI003B5C7361